MALYRETITLTSSGGGDMHDITGELSTVIGRSGIDVGICHVFNVGSTGVIGTVEFEPGLKRDIPELLNRLIPPSHDYGHEQTWHDGNGHSHLQATLMGPEITIPIENGELMSGVWQQVFHYEADIKPRQRRIIVTVIGEV